MFAAMFERSKVVEQLKTPGASLQPWNRLGVSAEWMVGIAQFAARIFRKPQPQPAQ
jgi:hypothetical protein